MLKIYDRLPHKHVRSQHESTHILQKLDCIWITSHRRDWPKNLWWKYFSPIIEHYATIINEVDKRISYFLCIFSTPLVLPAPEAELWEVRARPDYYSWHKALCEPFLPGLRCIFLLCVCFCGKSMKECDTSSLSTMLFVNNFSPFSFLHPNQKLGLSDWKSNKRTDHESLIEGFVKNLIIQYLLKIQFILQIQFKSSPWIYLLNYVCIPVCTLAGR